MYQEKYENCLLFTLDTLYNGFYQSGAELKHLGCLFYLLDEFT